MIVQNLKLLMTPPAPPAPELQMPADNADFNGLLKSLRAGAGSLSAEQEPVEPVVQHDERQRRPAGQTQDTDAAAGQQRLSQDARADDEAANEAPAADPAETADTKNVETAEVSATAARQQDVKAEASARQGRADNAPAEGSRSVTSQRVVAFMAKTASADGAAQPSQSARPTVSAEPAGASASAPAVEEAGGQALAARRGSARAHSTQQAAQEVTSPAAKEGEPVADSASSSQRSTAHRPASPDEQRSTAGDNQSRGAATRPQAPDVSTRPGDAAASQPSKPSARPAGGSESSPFVAAGDTHSSSSERGDTTPSDDQGGPGRDAPTSRDVVRNARVPRQVLTSAASSDNSTPGTAVVASGGEEAGDLSVQHRPVVAAPGRSQAPGQASAEPLADMQDFEPRQVTEQVLRGLRSVVQQRGGNLTLRLHPPDLGSLRIHVEMHNGVVSAMFQASSELVRNLLSRDMGTLRQALEAHGLTVERLQSQLTAGQQADAAAQQDADASANDGRSRGRFDQRQEPSREQLGRQPDGDGNADFRRELLNLVA